MQAARAPVPWQPCAARPKMTASQFLSSGASCVVKTRSLTPVKLGCTDRQRLAGIGVGRNGSKFKLGMTEDEANELGSGISSRADDSNLQRHIRLLVCDLCTDAHFAAVVMK